MVSPREQQITAFLHDAGWGAARRVALAGDASNRRYERLFAAQGAATAVLMDAPPERGEDTRPFARMSGHLARCGLSAPQIHAHDPGAGLMLLEDLGDGIFARHLEAAPQDEALLYGEAVEVLLHLHLHRAPALAHYNAALMADMATLAFDKYACVIDPDQAEAADVFRTGFAELLAGVADCEPVLILRDYHAENLLWLGAREGRARVGLLDYQDAMTGHRAYDLVSLLQDARRDVSPALETEMIARYINGSGVAPEAFRRAYALLGVQRNLRILGVFARLCTQYGKPQYLALMPRVWAHLRRGLADPAICAQMQSLPVALPAPLPENLARLRSLCPAPR